MENKNPSVSVVIPTRNRKDSLLHTIESLYKQTCPVYEIIVIDASDVPLTKEELIRNDFVNFSLIHSSPSVCAQRNTGIKKTKGEYIFLLDDDIVLDVNYIETILDFNKQNPEAVAVSGLVTEKNITGEWQYTFSEPSFFTFLWAYVFQLSIWAEIKEIKGNIFTRLLLGSLKSYYTRKGNSLSKAGWPLLTNFNKPYFRTQLYGLGASIIRKSWLEKNLYEEKLEPHGIGDNYGVAINLTEEEGVFVLSTIRAYHYKEASNRLSSVDAYYKRVVALHYFIITKKQLKISVKWLFWSLTGNLFTSTIKFNFSYVKVNLELMKMIFLNKNPLLKSKTMY
jgi:glycosyltransferase involved in cell wall biosynthesis